MNDTLKIIIEASISGKSIGNIEEQINELQKKINTSGIKVGIGVDKKLLTSSSNEVDDYIKRMQNSITRLKIGKDTVFANNEVKSELSTLEKMLLNLGNGSAISTKKIGLQFDNLRTKVAEVSNEFRNVNKDGYNFTDMISMAAKKVLIWQIGTGAIYGTIHAFQEMTSTIVELDSQVVQLKRVMDEGTNFESMLRGSMDIADQLGQKVTEVNKALISAAQAGYSGQDALDITKTSVIASNVSDMTPEESMSNMIAAMKAFKIEAKDSMEIIDKLNQVDNDFSVSTRNLADSVTHAGAAAQTYGVSLDQLIGYTTAIGETTRESGNVIGNMEKSIFSRLYSNDSINVLNGINVKVKDLNGENRKASDILSDIGSKWNSLTSTQQQNIGVTVAGRQQLTR